MDKSESGSKERERSSREIARPTGSNMSPPETGPMANEPSDLALTRRSVVLELGRGSMLCGPCSRDEERVSPSEMALSLLSGVGERDRVSLVT